MNALRKKIIYFLLAAVPLSPLAGVAASCIQDAAASGAQTAVAVEHAGHVTGDQGPHGPTSATEEDHSNSHNVHGDDSTFIECPCCDQCAVMCVLSGCNVMASIDDAFELSFADEHLHDSHTGIFRTGLAPHPLIRPPIS